MKTLLLMRHAKSSWDDKVDNDRDRPLSKRGKKDSERVGELLKKEKLIPELILASNAARTRQTAELLMEEIKYKGDICFLNKLYLAEIEIYIQEIQRITDDVRTVLLVGHSPSLDTLLQVATGKVESLPTGAVVHLTIPIECWREFQPGLVPAELSNFWRPKEL